ncbi:MAG: hypothetical protein AAGG08_10570 [Actinomycetota bacterium]
MASPIAGALDDGRHPGTIEEWVFAAWTDDGLTGVLSGHRIVGPTAWYWAALARRGRQLLHITDFHVPVRADPFIVKGEAMWAEHFRDARMEQWSIGNETYAAALDEPDEALDRAYGVPTPIAFDLEWYATSPALALTGADLAADAGYEQLGVVHGRVEILGEDPLDLTEVPGRRWHRWSTDPAPSPAWPATGRLTDSPPTRDSSDVAAPSAHRASVVGPLRLPIVAAHTGVRAPFAFPDGSVLDLVLTPSGWARRPDRARR